MLRQNEMKFRSRMPLAPRFSEGLGRNCVLVKIENHLGTAQLAVQPSVATWLARLL
jgi:hypothetical protein